MNKKAIILFFVLFGFLSCGIISQMPKSEGSRPDYRQKQAFSWTEAGDYSYIQCSVLQAITEHQGLLIETGNHSLRIAFLQSPNIVLYDRMAISGSFVYTGYTYQYTDKEDRERTVPIVVRLEDWKNGFKGIKYQY